MKKDFKSQSETTVLRNKTRRITANDIYRFLMFDSREACEYGLNAAIMSYELSEFDDLQQFDEV